MTDTQDPKLCIAHLFSKPSQVSLSTCIDLKEGACVRCDVTLLPQLDVHTSMYCDDCSNESGLCAVCGDPVEFDRERALRQCQLECKNTEHTSQVISLVFEPLMHDLDLGVISSMSRLDSEYVNKMTNVIRLA